MESQETESQETGHRVSEMIHGYWLSQAIYVAAKLELADLLTSGPRPVGDLAKACGADRSCLYRLLRALASVEMFAQTESGAFANTPLSERLRSDLPDSQWALAVMAGEESYRAWGELLHTVRTGETAFDKAVGRPIFEHLSENPGQAAIFDRAMTGVHGRETEPMIDAYDFSAIGALCDIGGGNGGVLAAILTRHVQLKGILFDLPHVVERAEKNLAATGAADRCQVISGNFFDSIPAGADAYLMRHVLHDWDDDNAVLILQNCRQVLPPDGRVLVVESIVPAGNEPSFSKLLDLAMMALPGGQERTEDEYRELFETAGLTLHQVTPTTGGVEVIEARAAL
jgi:SAM-dependent methyltransferase